MKKKYTAAAIVAVLCFMFMIKQVVYAEEKKYLEIKFVSSGFGMLKLENEEECEEIKFDDIPEGAEWSEYVDIPKVIPEEGYIFVGWSKNGTKEILTNFPESVDENLSYTANFALLSAAENEELPSPKKKTSLLYKLYLLCVEMGG